MHQHKQDRSQESGPAHLSLDLIIALVVTASLLAGGLTIQHLCSSLSEGHHMGLAGL